jgi:pimeloyl-ACP methyl ester carboxylesterase
MAALAEHFHVIAPDARGYGRTINAPAGPISYAQLADDLVALVAALELDRPRVAGFSDGAIAATVTAIDHPELFGALVNHSGYDYLNPQAASYGIMRQTLGGSPQATQADPEAAQRFFASSPQMHATFELMKSDHDGAQGEGHWKTLISETFDRCTQWPGHTFDDLAAITAPTLILTGDRDQFCTVEEGVQACRALPAGELAVLPNTGHLITPAHIEAMIAFLVRV